MEIREYFEKVMQDFNQNRKGRNLRKYCSDEDYRSMLPCYYKEKTEEVKVCA